VSDLEIHFKALKSAQDAYGNTADKNATQVAALTAKIEEQLKVAERLKNLKEFNLGTEELERANSLLEVENALINANAEDRAREIALIRLKNDVQTKGLDESNPKEREAIDRRREAITQNERLKAQGEELKKANELWTAPLKSALESIQSTAADMFDSMLERGSFSFEELGTIAKRMVRQMIAEFAALAVIRPMLAGVVGGLGSIGLVSPATAGSLGYGSGAGSSSFFMPSLGGGSSFGFLNNAIIPASYGGAPGGYDSIGQLISQGSPAGLGGLTWGQGLAGIGSIGFGAYNLATAKNAGGAFGGIGGILGGGLGLAASAGLIGSAFGPIGTAIGFLAPLLGSLFGGEEYKWDPLAGANIQFNPSANGYTSNATQQLGGKSIAGQFGGVSGTLDALFARAGGITNAGNAFGASIWNNQREGTTSTYLISPTQGSNQQTYDESGDPAAAVDRLIAKVFYNSIQNNAAMHASPTLRTAFGNKEPTSTAALKSLLDLIDAYDSFGKATVLAKTALEEINSRFSAMSAVASEYGLALAPIQAEQKKVTERYARDFIDGMIDPLAVQLRALEDQRKDSLASAEYIRDNVKDVYVDIARITEYWTNKRRELEEQYYQGSIGQLQALIRRLTYGDLANASPDTSLAGTRGTYEAALAQSRAGSASAFSNLAGYAETYTSTARSYFASSAEYDALISQIRRDLEEQVAARGGGGGGVTGSATANDASNAVLQSNAELRSMFATVINDNAELKSQMAALVAQLQRK
jgi:hypothetical protein